LVKAYKEGLRAFEAWQTLSVDERVARTSGAQARVLQHASRAPYYAELLRRAAIDLSKPVSIEQWQSLPPLEKLVLRERGAELIPTTTRPEWLRGQATGGSTGAPVKLKLGPVHQGWRWATHEYVHALAGIRPGDRAAYLWGAELDPNAVPSLWSRVSDFMVNRRMYNCFRLTDSLLEQYHRNLSVYRPRYFVGYASALALYADFLRRRGLEPGYPRRAIFTGAEKLEPSARALIASVFKVPVHETYGSRDCGAMAAQADPSGPLQVLLPYVLLEPFGDTAEDGSREVLVTHLVPSDGTVMIRYRIGDRAKFGDGSPFVTCLREVTGRVLDHIRLPSGKIIHSTQFPHLLKDYDVVEYQVVQLQDGSVTASLVTGATFGAEQEQALGRRLANMIPEVPVRIAVVPTIERGAAGKRRPVISHYHDSSPAARA
jgi:phenylacetate-CoA ligase